MPFAELERQKLVDRFLKLEISKEKELQEITELAAKICGTPIALITLIDNDTQHLRFKVGLDITTTPRDQSFCDHVIAEKKMMVVKDTFKDERFVMNPLVTGSPDIRFYAGSPLNTTDGHSLGSLCVIDKLPRELDETQLMMLEILAKQVIHILEFETSLHILKEQYIETKNDWNKLRSFFEASNASHLLISKEGTVLAYNHAFEKTVLAAFGLKVGIGSNVLAYFGDSYKPEFLKNFNHAINGKPTTSERQVKDFSGETWWHLTYDPAKDQNGEIIGVSFNATDISERILNEKKLRTQDLTLRNIAWMQSHELRKPVSSILGLMEIIRTENYEASKEVLLNMQMAIEELDEKIKLIVNQT